MRHTLLLCSIAILATACSQNRFTMVTTTEDNPWVETSAYDDTAGDLTKKVEVTVNDDTVQYKVRDSAGNITIRYRRIPYRTAESMEDR